ncbi:heparan-alpha-glucosaminide N-acetyltransferase domain-containing protein [Microbacterium sp. 2FI]|uniref:heparan-alpha-glucosaminide N-acetyltransferase domain-containing protein n=1 Tax=Microbacterium sp. 2FI TaxID=2502193 RepID=UPI0010F8074E|nr:heparan-alpha-glucosaminide N-acetyltransferase domain-containing protein [Microbacterium sp. 2FI]
MAASAGLTNRRSRLATRWERLNGPQRIAGVDLARGLAVLGMFAAHLLWIREDFDWSDQATWIAVVDGRSSILFATLAGVSIGIVTGGRTPLQWDAMATARWRLGVRAGLLWLLGILLILTGVPVYVILPAYAILFLLAIPLTGLRARVLLPLAAALAIVMPILQVMLDDLPVWGTRAGGDLSLAIGWHYPFTTWIAFVVAGLGVARAGVRRLSVQLWMLGAGSALAFVGYSAGGSDAAAPASEPSSLWSAAWTSAPHSSGLLEVIGSGGFALAVIGASMLVCRSVVVWIVLPLRAVGAMPLTAYTAQLVVWALIALEVLGRTGDLTGFRDLEPFWPFVLATLVLCTAWALLIGRGPLEWAVDRVARLIVPSALESDRAVGDSSPRR